MKKAITAPHITRQKRIAAHRRTNFAVGERMRSNGTFECIRPASCRRFNTKTPWLRNWLGLDALLRATSARKTFFASTKTTASMNANRHANYASGCAPLMAILLYLASLLGFPIGFIA
ncbi:hypothetical protein ACDY96_03325 [Rhizobium mongolense]|uniref:hypothetical protein n=1 Tax=Rhizobium TaxID=379 RepID=UPI0024B26A53|nr:hypothetical protein [Rhizobium sp. CC1099]WFU86127.1 hypothetical protein QA644_13325 [Rhizobium sp. CC1099]